jgi:hypothetical protein
MYAVHPLNAVGHRSPPCALRFAHASARWLPARLHLAELLNAPEVIFMSAFRSDLEFDRPILTKPFKVGDLTAAVRRILEKPSRPAAGSV